MNTANLFRVLSEFIVLLLGALLILLAVTGRVGLPGSPAALVLLGVVLIYWGVRALARKQAESERTHALIRAGSLVVVGILVLAVRVVPVRYADLLLELAGGVLVLRGLVGGVLFARRT